jgi:hypothetical protein
MLDQARENLEKHFAVVGVSERFDEFVRLASVELGWDVPRYQRKNVSESRLMLNSIDRETLGVIEHFNRLDIELYKSAAARFEKLFIKIAEDHEDFP